MTIKYRLCLSIVLEDEDGSKAIQWKTAIKTKAIQLKNAGILPAWTIGTAKIGIYPYFIGGDATVEIGIPCVIEIPL